MKDIYPIWKMCFVFRDREMSRNTDYVRSEMITQGFSGVDLENQIIIGRSQGKDYGLPRGELIGAYTHKYYPELRRDDNSVDVDKVRKINTKVLDEAEEALKNCIGLKFFEEKNGLLYLNASGRMLVSEPRWQNPISCNKEEKWNLQLIFEYIKTLGPGWSIILLIVSGIIGFIFGKL